VPSARRARAPVGRRSHRHAVAGVGSGLAGGVEQQLVELVAAHLEGVGAAGGERTVEAEDVGHALADRRTREVGADLAHADGLDLVEHAEAFEDRQVHRQQGLADVETRVAILFEHEHAPAHAGQRDRGGAAGRTAADDQHITFDDIAFEGIAFERGRSSPSTLNGAVRT
jgi:hypothetical protein